MIIIKKEVLIFCYSIALKIIKYKSIVDYGYNEEAKLKNTE